MTIKDAYLIFTRGYLMFNDTKMFLDGKNQYHSENDPEYPSGTYEFVQLSGKVYLRTTPPILSGIKDLEVGVCLGNLPVEFFDQP